MESVIAAGVALVIGLAGGYAVRQWADRLRKAGVQKDINAMLEQAKRDAEVVINQGKTSAKDIEQQAKDGLYKKREEFIFDAAYPGRRFALPWATVALSFQQF